MTRGSVLYSLTHWQGVRYNSHEDREDPRLWEEAWREVNRVAQRAAQVPHRVGAGG